MAQKYVVVERKNPLKPQEPAKFYAMARSNRRVDTDEVISRVSERSSYSIGELKGCITEFLLEMKNQLSLGNIVLLGDMGSFRQRNGREIQGGHLYQDFPCPFSSGKHAFGHV